MLGTSFAPLCVRLILATLFDERGLDLSFQAVGKAHCRVLISDRPQGYWSVHDNAMFVPHDKCSLFPCL